jgi:atypical dual specificity phosphatase
MEGVYIRFEDRERKITTTRGKVVRGDFIAGNEHWSKGKIVWNGLKREEEVGEY